MREGGEGVMSVVALPVEPFSIISSKQRSAFCFFVSMASRVFGGVVNSFKESSKILRHSSIIWEAFSSRTIILFARGSKKVANIIDPLNSMELRGERRGGGERR